MEELVGLEPTHTGFAIRGITSFAIAPMLENHFYIEKKMICKEIKVAESKGFEPSEA